MGHMGPPCEHRFLDTYTGRCKVCGTKLAGREADFGELPDLASTRTEAN